LTGRSLYEEYRPPSGLRDRVMCLWTQQVDSANGEHHHPVLPDGCVDIVWIGGAAPVVAGPATRRVTVALPAGTGLVGVRFRPGWAAASLGLPADELRDQEVPLAEIWRNAGALGDPRRLSIDLAQRLSGCAVPDPLIRWSVAWLAQHPASRIRDLARLTGAGERQLHRRFRQAVGYGPKTFQRIMRFQRLLSAASARRELASVAADLGYADQAHMCRDVLALAGQPMSDLFNTAGGSGGYPKPSMAEWLRRTGESAHHADYAGCR
jgi:AraC-like DNA-binding protein